MKQPWKRILISDRKNWPSMRARGFWRYAIFRGAVDLGIVGGLLAMGLAAIAANGFSFSSMSFSGFFGKYLIWLPLCMMLGFLSAAFIWIQEEGRVTENPDENKPHIEAAGEDPMAPTPTSTTASKLHESSE